VKCKPSRGACGPEVCSNGSLKRRNTTGNFCLVARARETWHPHVGEWWSVRVLLTRRRPLPSARIAAEHYMYAIGDYAEVDYEAVLSC
jgi:hypothetical protein